LKREIKYKVFPTSINQKIVTGLSGKNDEATARKGLVLDISDAYEVLVRNLVFEKALLAEKQLRAELGPRPSSDLSKFRAELFPIL